MALDDKSSLFQRLVTYKPLSQSQSMFYCTRLAEFGYTYAEQDKELECVSCKARVRICDTLPDIARRLRHERGCLFEDLLKTVESKYDEEELVAVAIVSGAETTTADSFRGAEAFTEDSYITKAELNDDNTGMCKLGAASCYSKSNSKFQTLGFHGSLFLPDLSSKYYKENVQSFEHESKQPSGSSFSTSKISGYSNMFTEYIEFPQLFTPEHLELHSRRDLKPLSLNERDCDKNPGHFVYFNTINLKSEQIPTQFRCPEMLNILKVMSDLTVRIVVSTTSSRRRNGLQHNVRVGTGFVIEHLAEVKTSLENHRKLTSEKSKFKSLQKLLSLGKKKTFGLVFLQTSRHLVYNVEEAPNTTVEFFYDSPDRKEIVSLEAKCLLTSTTPGDGQCLLVCECTDHVLIQRLNQLQRGLFDIANKLPLKSKKGMSKKLFMIHHPHGGPKVVSYGDYVTVKYKLNISDAQNGKATLTKITARDQVGPDVSAYRKTLFYAADTCPGSCGAPILTFCPRQPGANGDVTFKLDIWMHNGVETSHKLGASVLKTCTKVDFQQPMLQSSIPEEDSEGEDSLGKQQVNSPVYKVVTTPSHPEFTLYQTRLESFIGWTMDTVLKPEYLALSGFYYTGDSDCVRCFQCGLGLRTWKQGDDVITEHEKYRPTCPYLKSLPKGQEVNRAATVSSLVKPSAVMNIELTEAQFQLRENQKEDEAGTQSNENLSLKLLEAENTIIKNQLKCKVCFKSDIKDVFLPCGELYAYSECSKLLTQCPSCGKQILATVTVYLN